MTAQAWAALMRRVGYTAYVAQGGDQGAAFTDYMAIQAPAGLVGIHLNFLRRRPSRGGAFELCAPVGEAQEKPSGVINANDRAYPRSAA